MDVTVLPLTSGAKVRAVSAAEGSPGAQPPAAGEGSAPFGGGTSLNPIPLGNWLWTCLMQMFRNVF